MNADAYKINIGVYVLDNDKDLLVLIEKILKKNQVVNYFLFNDSEKFLLNLKQNNFHVCIIDFFLDKGKTAFDILNAIKDKNLSSHCYSIVMSNQGSFDIIVDLLNEGCIQKYLPKNRPDFSTKLIDFINNGITAIHENFKFYSEVQSRFEATKQQFKKLKPSIPTSY